MYMDMHTHTLWRERKGVQACLRQEGALLYVEFKEQPGNVWPDLPVTQLSI